MLGYLHQPTALSDSALTAASPPIDRLRSIRTRLRGGADGDWFAACLAEYEAGAKLGLTLGDAFGLGLEAGGRPWWEIEMQARRDKLLRAIAGKYFCGLSSRAAAREILREAARYEAAGWRQHRPFKSPPAELAGTLRADLFALLKIGEPLSDRTVRRALGHETPAIRGPRTGTPSRPNSTKEPNASRETKKSA
jgi:hypothetical protein